jgi:hypothetical protein
MKERFKALEGIDGLFGIVASHRGDGELIYSSPPLDQRAAHAMGLSLQRVLENLPGQVSQLTANFSSGKIMVFVLREQILAISVGETFDVRNLRDRIREKVKRIPVARILPSLEGKPLDADSYEALLGAVEHMAQQARGELGVFVTANTLRTTLEVLDHAALKPLEVGKDAHIKALTVPEVDIAETSRSIARLARVFFASCNNIVPTFPPELALSLIEADRMRLEELGFYEAWAEAADL